jgi:sugar-specific transcriptional regulator TrmB
MTNDATITALEELGLTRLEAQTYIALLRDGPSTAYGIAKSIGKPASNAYRIIDSLVAKQLVITEEGAKKGFRALPWEQMLSRLKQRFQKNQEIVAADLSRIQSLQDDNRVYRLNSSEQVFERCRSVLENARDLVLIDAFPDILPRIAADIDRAAARNVEVRIKSYQAVEIPGARVVIDYRGDAVLANWKFQWLIVVADGNEYVQACFEPDGRALIQAIWTSSAFLSWVAHGGLSSDMTVDLIQRALREGGDIDAVSRVIEDLHLLSKRNLAGRIRLMGHAKSVSRQSREE